MCLLRFEILEIYLVLIRTRFSPLHVFLWPRSKVDLEIVQASIVNSMACETEGEADGTPEVFEPY